MAWHAYLRLLAVLLIAGTSVIAQTGAPSAGNGDSVIPLAEAEQHLVEQRPPIYPALAKAAHIEGTIHLTLEVDSNGAVVRVVQSSGHPLLALAAINAAKQYCYRPFDVNGTPGTVLVEAAISFSLNMPILHVPFPEIENMDSVVVEYDDGYFHLKINGNGLVEYSGAAYVLVEGKHERHIEAGEVQALLETFRRADFLSLRDDYSVSVSDGPASTSTSIRIGGLNKVVVENWAEAAPAALKGVEEAVLKYSHSEQWVKGNADTIPELLAETSNPSARRETLSEVLPRAALYSGIAVVRDILAHPVDLERHGPYHGTALMLAADRGLPDMVSALLKAGANPHATDKDGRNALTFGAGSGNAQVVQLLLAAGLKGNTKDKYGDTALMAAAATGNPECVRLLLNGGAKVNARNRRRQTALLSGATGDAGFYVDDSGRGRAEVPDEMIHRDAVVKLLLGAGANIRARSWGGETALFSLEDDAVGELIRSHIDLEARDKNGDTALTRTVSESIAKLLLDAGANVNARGHNGQTALMQAAGNNYVEELGILLKVPGVRLDLRDNDGNTALMKARGAHLDDCIRLLVSAGATQ